MKDSHPTRGRSLRALIVGAAAATALASLAVLAGVGVANGSISAAQYQYGPKGKTTICHKGKTITVSNAALAAHKKHGDTLGPCASAKAKHKGKHEEKGKAKAEEKKSDDHGHEKSEEKKSDDHGAAKAEEKKSEDHPKGKAEEKSNAGGNGKGKGK